VLLAALLLFAAIFGGRVLDTASSSGVTVLYVLPVVLVAVELGRRAGIAAGVVAFALFSVWAPTSPVQLSVIAYLARAVTFVVVGLVAGHLADRLRAAVDHLQSSARHFELARDLLCTTSFDGYITQLNGSWQDCLGWTAGELMARPSIDFVHPDDRERTLEEARRAAGGEVAANYTNRYATKDGGWRWIEWSSQADPERRTIYAAARDVTERHEAEEQLRYLADHDPLSGVYNRRRFEQELDRELAHSACRGSCGAVLLLDVDDFKAINDSLGHATGDAVIARLGETLSGRLRSSDVVARIGGDEFAVLLRRVDVATALELASSVQELVAEALCDVADRPLGVSIGLAPLVPGETLDSDDLLGRADRAMYAAKRGGGGCVVVSQETMAAVEAGADAGR
jgi:diguanylate cyclase